MSPDPGVHGDARGDRGVDAAGGAELGDRHRQSRTGLGVVGDAGALLPEDQQAVARQRGLLEAPRAGHVVDGDDGQPGVGGERQQVSGGVVVAQPLIAVGHHGAAAVPAAPADDVHGVDGERVGGAHHRADVGVVAEVLDRDVQRVPALCRCRRRSPRASSTGRRRRRCGCRRRAAAPGRSAGRRAGAWAVARGRRRRSVPHSVGPGVSSVIGGPQRRRACRPATPTRRAARR